MSNDLDLTGTWVGEYRQHNRPHAIAAVFHQAGEVLTGTMRDVEPDQEMSVTDATSDSGDVPGTDERIVARLRAMFPDEPASPVRYISHLPPRSTLEGWVRGSRVYFLKSYRG